MTIGRRDFRGFFAWGVISSRCAYVCWFFISERATLFFFFFGKKTANKKKKKTKRANQAKKKNDNSRLREIKVSLPTLPGATLTCIDHLPHQFRIELASRRSHTPPTDRDDKAMSGSAPLLRCSLWCRRILFFSGGGRRLPGLSKKYDDEDDAELAGGGGGYNNNNNNNNIDGASSSSSSSSSSLWQDAQRMLKLFLFSLLVLLLVTPDVPRWAATRAAPAMASLACSLGGSENVALCEENFNAALKGDFPIGTSSSSSKAAAAGAADAVVNCAETCGDDIAAAKGVNMDDAAGVGAAIIRGAGVSDCKPMRLNCTELEDELWGRINSLESALARRRSIVHRSTVYS